MKRRSRSDAVVAAAAVAVLMVLVVLRESLTSSLYSVPSTYDTGPRGYAALYELLARERLRVQRFEEPLSQLISYRGTLVIAGPDDDVPLINSGPQDHTLETWVRSGGTLVLLGNLPRAVRVQFGLPAQSSLRERAARSGCGIAGHFVLEAPFRFGAPLRCDREAQTLAAAAGRSVVTAYRRGNGLLIHSATAQLFDNAHLARAGNAAFAYAVLARSSVSFDEYGFGYSRTRSFWQVLPTTLRVAVIIAAFALVTAIAGALLPSAPPKAGGGTAERNSGEYMRSLAAMLRRGGARRATVRRLGRAVEELLAARGAGDPHIRERIEQARALQTLAAPTQADLLAVGKLFASVRKET
ncbi:MAG TPA: DUF4350 domain-containing protein [Candidatus Baltobacteraceae bacterium]|jgi:hypothetical protein|nr:DUF4350 domain-containing protein [Candidatus Baltobacteraceae bacterium]